MKTLRTLLFFLMSAILLLQNGCSYPFDLTIINKCKETITGAYTNEWIDLLANPSIIKSEPPFPFRIDGNASLIIERAIADTGPEERPCLKLSLKYGDKETELSFSLGEIRKQKFIIVIDDICFQETGQRD